MKEGQQPHTQEAETHQETEVEPVREVTHKECSRLLKFEKERKEENFNEYQTSYRMSVRVSKEIGKEQEDQELAEHESQVEVNK